MNTFVVNTTFLDDDGFVLEKEIFKVDANSTEEAYDIIDEEILENQEMYPSDDYDLELLDVH